MTTIKLIDNLILDKYGVRIKDGSGKLTALHRQQGALDGACAVYSLVMDLLYIGYLNASDIDGGINRRGHKGDLLKHLFEEQGLIINGYYFKTLAADINNAVPELNAYTHQPQTPDVYLQHIKNYIDKSIPVVVSVNWEGGDNGHAMLAIGYEQSGDGIGKVFCLDPGYPSPEFSYWNCFIKTNKASWSCVNENKGPQKCSFSSLLLVEQR